MVEDGDYVEKDQAIAEVDSDKATLELPAEESGTITFKAEEGDAVIVGRGGQYILEDFEDAFHVLLTAEQKDRIQQFNIFISINESFFII